MGEEVADNDRGLEGWMDLLPGDTLGDPVWPCNPSRDSGRWYIQADDPGGPTCPSASRLSQIPDRGYMTSIRNAASAFAVALLTLCVAPATAQLASYDFDGSAVDGSGNGYDGTLQDGGSFATVDGRTVLLMPEGEGFMTFPESLTAAMSAHDSFELQVDFMVRAPSNGMEVRKLLTLRTPCNEWIYRCPGIGLGFWGQQDPTMQQVFMTFVDGRHGEFPNHPANEFNDNGRWVSMVTADQWVQLVYAVDFKGGGWSLSVNGDKVFGSMDESSDYDYDIEAIKAAVVSSVMHLGGSLAEVSDGNRQQEILIDRLEVNSPSSIIAGPPGGLLPPSNVVIEAPEPVVFSWNPVSTATGYEIQVYDSIAPNSPLIDTAVTDTFYVPTWANAPTASLTWRVRGTSETGTGPWKEQAFVYKSDQLTLRPRPEVGDPTGLEVLTDEIFAIWYNKNFDSSARARLWMNILLEARQSSLADYGMTDPPTVEAGLFLNIYMHRPNDGLPVGQGVGTDVYGMPYMTLPYHTSETAVLHEGFHLFQYGAPSRGFDYSGDSGWFVEATANWFAYIHRPNWFRSHVEVGAIEMMPQQEMWRSWSNGRPNTPGNWQRLVKQYAMSAFLYYLTETSKAVTRMQMTEGFYRGLSDMPQEHLRNIMTQAVLRKEFADWAAHNVADFDYLAPSQVATARAEVLDYGSGDDFWRFTAEFGPDGSNGWVSPTDEGRPGGWAYNVFKMTNDRVQDVQFMIDGGELGTDGGDAAFQGRVVVKDSDGFSFHDVAMRNAYSGEVTLSLDADDTEAYLVVVATPNVYGTNQQYPYQAQIVAGASVNTETELPRETSLSQNYPNPFNPQTVIPFELGTAGHVTLDVYNVLGERVQRLIDAPMAAGQHETLFNASGLSTGLYMVQLRTEVGTWTRRMTLVR